MHGTHVISRVSSNRTLPDHSVALVQDLAHGGEPGLLEEDHQEQKLAGHDRKLRGGGEVIPSDGTIRPVTWGCKMAVLSSMRDTARRNAKCDSHRHIEVEDLAARAKQNLSASLPHKR